MPACPTLKHAPLKAQDKAAVTQRFLMAKLNTDKANDTCPV